MTLEEQADVGRIDDLVRLTGEAKAVWNREGKRVLAGLHRRGGTPLDEDVRFLAADGILGELMSELNATRQRVSTGRNRRIFTASVARHDAEIEAREIIDLSDPAESRTGIRAEIAKRLAALG